MGERWSLVLTGLGTAALAGHRFLTCFGVSLFLRRGRAFLRGSFNPLGKFPRSLQLFLLLQLVRISPPGVAPLSADRTTNVRRTGTALRAVWVNLSRETTVKTVHGKTIETLGGTIPDKNAKHS